jgi:hypothetical protein
MRKDASTTAIIKQKRHEVGEIFFSSSLAQQPNAGQGRLIVDVSRSRTLTYDSP